MVLPAVSGELFDKGPINLIGPIFPIAKRPYFTCFWMLLAPNGQFVSPEVILKIHQQFFGACPGHADQLQFGLLGGAGGHAVFGDLLFAAPRSLHRLINGAAATADEPIAEHHRGIMDNLRHLIRLQISVPAVGSDSVGVVTNYSPSISSQFSPGKSRRLMS
jgi:hypothetical protein